MLSVGMSRTDVISVGYLRANRTGMASFAFGGRRRRTGMVAALPETYGGELV